MYETIIENSSMHNDVCLQISKISDIILTLLDDEFERQIFNAAVRNVYKCESSVRVNSFALLIRELISKFLVRHSPYNEIIDCDWFIQRCIHRRGNELEQQKPTKFDLIKYAIIGGLTQDVVVSLNINIDKDVYDIKRKYQDLNKYIHIERKFFNQQDSVQLNDVLEILKTLQKFFNMIDGCRAKVKNIVEFRVYDEISQHLREEYLDVLGELSTHYLIDDITLDIDIKNIDHENIIIYFNGDLSVKLQYGSNNEVVEGDGVVTDEFFPICGMVKVLVSDLSQVSVNRHDMKIDVDGFYE